MLKKPSSSFKHSFQPAQAPMSLLDQPLGFEVLESISDEQSLENSEVTVFSNVAWPGLTWVLGDLGDVQTNQ